MSDQRKGSTSYLPIYSYREAILQSVREHSTTIIVGETGCGKSTQLPQYIADYYLTCPNHNDLDCGNDDDSDFKNKDIGKGENNNNNNNMNNMNKNKKRTHSDSFYPDSSRQGRKKNLVVCTQPRRVAAVTIAQKVATERKKQSLFLKPIFLFTIIVVVFLLCLM
jgi:HrpA-like RNA helicase